MGYVESPYRISVDLSYSEMSKRIMMFVVSVAFRKRGFDLPA